jgi:hypothetical protein
MTNVRPSLTSQVPTGDQKRIASIPGILDSRLVSYTLAAGATLAASTPCKAQVLFTPNNSFLKPPSSLVIDLNHDGVSDFLLKLKEFFATTSSFAYGFVGRATIYGLRSSNQVVAPFGSPRPLKRGDRIASGNIFQPLGVLATGRGYWGGFDNLQNRFVGVKLVVNGEVHFGWIGFRRVDAKKTVQVTLAGWAYETAPDTAILAGDTGLTGGYQPTSLEILSAGHSGIEQRRKRIQVN